MNVIVLLAGSSEPIESKGVSYQRLLSEIKGKPLIQHVLSSLKPIEKGHHIFVHMLKDDIDSSHLDDIVTLLIPTVKICVVNKLTKGAACTALLSIESINNDSPLVIINGDQVVDADLPSLLKKFEKSGWDGGIVTFESVHPRWSYVKLNDENLVEEVAEKRPISKNATAGIYYFKHGSLFVEAAMKMIEKRASVNGLYYICPTYNELILKQKKIGIYPIERSQYFPLSSLNEIDDFRKHISR
ncbi:MAG: hypothetical protein A2007_02325 [Verrucomicrobia bacterium GWC2_42_7]|nr:MAG: hypothetical protein A2007_02325 [Verrucomicrobia bacterium GWC2_42_7]